MNAERTAYSLEAMRTRIRRCAEGDGSPAELDDWLFPLLWPDEGDADARELAWSAELLLMELGRGHWTETVFREQLVLLIQPRAVASA